MESDPYEVLDITEDASKQEVKQAYREKVKEYHPDTSDRDDAEEIFKQVKEAYETVYPKADEKEPDKTTREDSTDERRSEVGKTETGENTDTSYGESVSPEGFDDFEILRRYDDGWRLARKHVDGEDNWFLFSELETAVHIDGNEVVYLGPDGSTSDEPVYFDTRTEAETVYKSKFDVGVGAGSGGTGKRRHSTSRRTHGRTDRENGTSFSFDGDYRSREGKTKVKNLDSLWCLYYQETDDKEEPDTRRRWFVTTDVNGDHRFIDADGRYRETEVWFGDEQKAEKAYQKYRKRTSESETDRKKGSGSRSRSGSRSSSTKERRRSRPGRWRNNSTQSGGSSSSQRTETTADSVGKFTSITDIISEYRTNPSRLLRWSFRLVVFVVSLPLLVPLKMISLVGIKRFVGGIAVATVGPSILVFMQSMDAVYNPFLRGMSVTDAFVLISLPSLTIAVVVQFVYETLDTRYYE